MKIYLQRKAFIIATKLMKFAGLNPLCVAVEHAGIGCGLVVFGLPKYSDRFTESDIVDVRNDPFDNLDKCTTH